MSVYTKNFNKVKYNKLGVTLIEDKIIKMFIVYLACAQSNIPSGNVEY